MDTGEHKMSEIKMEIFGGSDNDSRSEQNLIDHRSASIERKYKDKSCSTIQLKNKDFDIMDLSPTEVREEYIKSEGDIDIHYEYVKTEIVDKKPVCKNDAVNDKSFFIKFPRDQNASNFSTMQGWDMTQGVKSYCLFHSHLGAHDRNHAAKKPFHCKYCCKAFAQLSHLKDHENIHTGEKPYDCKNCSRAFATSSNLKMHERIHTGQKSYICKTCNKAFTQSSQLKVHESNHTRENQYVCKNCSKGFVTPSTLKRHEMIHTGKTLFHCKICSKIFGHSSYLKKHERTHTEKK